MSKLVVRHLVAVFLVLSASASLAGELFDMTGFESRKPENRVFPRPGPKVTYHITSGDKTIVVTSSPASKANFSQPIQLFKEPTQPAASILSEAPALFSTIKID